MSHTETTVCRVWREVLGPATFGDAPETGATSRPDADEDLLALDISSLDVVRVLSSLRRELGQRIPLATMFEHPTVRSLAAKVDAVAAGTESF
ncbi:acyl carrier protein [Streptomyces griseoruber]|uniref:acyl carrier protein n=1 Tax=Streptomyces griseoruber TaxID=1943 RepID=UPI0006E1D327|nr:acyl carrier protein [Streptomyces griseoruber]